MSANDTNSGNRKAFTDEEMADELRSEIRAVGGPFRFQKIYGLGNSHLYKFIKGQIPMQPSFPPALGYKRGWIKDE